MRKIRPLLIMLALSFALYLGVNRWTAWSRVSQVESYRKKAVEAFRQGSIDQAIPALQKALQVDPNSPELHYHLALAYEVIGREEEAVASYLKAVELNPALATPHYNLAILAGVAGDQEDREAELLQATKKAPYFASAYYLLGEGAFAAGRWAEAVGWYEKALATGAYAPFDRVKVYLRLADLYLRQGDRQGAIRQWQKVLEIDPGNRQAREGLKLGR